MTKFTPRRILKRLPAYSGVAATRLYAARRGTGVVLAAAVFLAFAVISCRTVNRSIVMLPNVPGAKYIGSKECEQCHEEIYKNFATADHARLIAEGPNALEAGCESCHGPGSLHSDSGGEVKPPNSFAAGRPGGEQFRRLAHDAPGSGHGDGLLLLPRRRAGAVRSAESSSRAGRPHDLHGVSFAAQGLCE